MLRLCLTLFVLLGLQVAGIGAGNPVAEECKSLACSPISSITAYDGYEEYLVPNVSVLFTSINGTDLKTATDIALDRFFDYSHFNNYADTIVPITAPWGVYIPFEDGIIKPEFSFLISIPLEVQKPPDARDPSVHVIRITERRVYIRTYKQKTENYGQLADEFKKDLENDQHSFDSGGAYIAWFNTRGLMQIAFNAN